MTSKLLFLAGSARLESLNKKLATHAASIAEAQGASVTLIDLKDYPMPIYNGDDEEANGLPDAAKQLKQCFVAHDGFFIASPEYNSSLPPLLKNSLDWISRPETKEEPSLIAFRGKVAAISAASPGGFGGLRGLVPLRMMLNNIGVTVISDQLAVPSAFSAFDDDGKLKSDKQREALGQVVKRFVEVTGALRFSD